MFLTTLTRNLKNLKLVVNNSRTHTPSKVAHSRIERNDLRQRICIAYKVPPAQAELQIEAALRRQQHFKPSIVKLK